MGEIEMSTVRTRDGEELASTVQDTWRLLMGVGVVLTVVGLAAIFTPLFTSIALSFLLGAYLVVGGIAHLAHAVSGRGWAGFLGQTILALVFVVAGIAFLLNPLVGLSALTLLLIIFFLAEGLVEIGMGLRLRPARGWLLVVISGIISLAVALFVWLEYPSSALWAVGLLFGIGLFTSGLSIVATAMGGRAVAKGVVDEKVGEVG
ncbi:Uncharacterized membrane protein HdeD, DUF308 family [Haladaptatus litoreus]|uniref:Uncharacterized membrane protein HdeD, DUF308 family n=1 Tax=Haladaptatus litoreus TaxID=553468 RepID=A0A1N7EAM3_9EURY|nr:DUF308 domain-containing protein [Haladaptatus litoreus]SIR85079.1 Uncharacterized membrane protein HdeD, DUF308 family [Haladaptatus litoreus]